MKFYAKSKRIFNYRSLPPWERGLKFPSLDGNTVTYIVAPPVGAWIEITTEDQLAAIFGRSPRGSVD